MLLFLLLAPSMIITIGIAFVLLISVNSGVFSLLDAVVIAVTAVLAGGAAAAFVPDVAVRCSC